MSDPAQLPIEQRLMLAAKDWLSTPITGNDDLEAVRQVLAAIPIRTLDEDTVITAKTDPDKKPRLILFAEDHGQVKLRVPIRILRLMLTIRGNAKVPAGQVDAFQALTGALEKLLDSSNLRLAITSSARAVVVMLATRMPGNRHSMEGDIRSETYALDIRGICSEHTSG